ncbi:single-stranded DNA-binding protein [Corynebacterium macginleyi]|uniref:single-stranded DNA-binding protein n=1 Tax=Corynebacterium macginleyi TaxID=38290 RepID=UPI001F33A742|nr:single-stranded DNA-binding protein [Corynebacterium macginleyi]
MSQYPVMLTGRLTQDPILTKTSTGAYKTKLRIASSRRVPDRPADTGANADGQRGQQQWRDVDHLFIDVEMWNQFAINVKKSLAKGMPLLVCGSIVSDQWRDDEGKDHYRTFIKAQYVGLDLNRHVIGAKRLAPQYNQENIAIPELGDNEVEPDVDNSAPGILPPILLRTASKRDIVRPLRRARNRRGMMRSPPKPCMHSLCHPPGALARPAAPGHAF